MIHCAFTKLGLNRIFATAAYDNLASIRVMKKVGIQWVSQNKRGVEYEILAYLGFSLNT